MPFLHETNSVVSNYRFSKEGEMQCKMEEDILKLIWKRKRVRAKEYTMKPHSEMRVAIVCNWLTKCGISTYSKYLVDSMRPMVNEIRIFSE